jgi:hypothetical protein
MDMDILSGDDVDLFDAIPFPLLDDDLTLNTKYLEYKNSDNRYLQNLMGERRQLLYLRLRLGHQTGDPTPVNWCPLPLICVG